MNDPHVPELGSSSSWLEQAHPDDRRHLEVELATLLSDPGTRELRTVGRFRAPGPPGTEPAYEWRRVHVVRGAEGAAEACLEPMHEVGPELESLARRIRRVETMLATVPECFKVLDEDLRLVDMNSTGLELIESRGLDEVRGVSVLELLLAEHHEVFQREMASTLAGERTVLRFEIEGLAGTRRWMEQVAVALPPLIEGARPRHIAAFTRDISGTKRLIADLEAARERAEAASVAKTEFLANMSHEIRTPLTAILGFADLLADAELPAEERREFLDTIRQNGRHLLSVINDVLDLAKIESGKLGIELGVFSPVELVEEVARLLRVEADSKDLALNVSYETPLPRLVETDRSRLKQILLNLVGNAVKFTPSGRVDVVCRRETEDAEPRLRFSIRDTGIGMEEHQLDRAFDAFSQADSSASRAFGGTGLGLSISRNLATLMGGSIVARSTPGAGSRFDLVVPLREATRLDEEQPDAPARARASRLRGLRILLAEDGRDNRRLVEFILSRAGASVTCVGNGREALDALSSPPGFDLVLMDMQMPVLDGYGATRALRSLGVELPVVALTAAATEDDRARCLAAGCDDHASKPVEVEDLIALCERWAAVRRRRDAG